jgi:uncharacterized protein (TIGR02172 family)
MKFGKIIGVGNTASVYEWEEGKVLKLFNQGYPNDAVENEYHNAMAIRDMNFAKPKAYEIISYEERKGIIYDSVEGETLLDRVMRTGDVQECAKYMGKLHKAIIQNEISNVTNYKDFLRYHLPNALLPIDKQKKLLQMIDKLPNGNALCHGDFHPGNILISGGFAYAIDFMNVCHGDFLYDVARTVFLVEYTPVPAETKDIDMLLHLKKTLTDLYLIQMNVTREMIQDYLTVIITVRKGECPNE